MIYELRHYVAVEGRDSELLDRFQRKTLPLFDELGFRLLGFWQEASRPAHIWYLLWWQDEQSKESGWQNLRHSPQWQRIKAETEANGPLIERICTRTLIEPTPDPYPAKSSAGPINEQEND